MAITMTTSENKTICFGCSKPIELPLGTIGRSATCDHCGADLKVCLNCVFFDRASYNECKEPQAERVLAKDKRNFCDFFRLGAKDMKGDNPAQTQKQTAYSQLDELFKKRE